MSKIKFCGIQPDSDLDYINQLAPDYIGMVFAPKSKRVVTFEEAKKISQTLKPEITRVGVFVDAPESLIAKLVNNQVIQVIQLHGAEDEATIRHYQQTLKVPVIKAFGIQTPDDVDKAIQSPADYLLFDYKVVGSGKTFDWRYIQEVKRDYFLAVGSIVKILKMRYPLIPMPLI
ncbi:phosphoribosylanthranilate isomerase [Enterococcus cecorum]